VARETMRGYTSDMEERNAWRQMAWWFGGIVVGFKLWTILLAILFSAQWPTVWYLALNHVAWFAGLVLLVWGPLTFWYRLVRMRRRRGDLLRAEWEISEHSHRW